MISFGIKAQKEALLGLAHGLNDVLIASGFETSGHWEWRRKAAWKVDEVDLVVKGGFAQYILPSFRVLLPLLTPSRLGESEQYIAQVNIPRLLRPETGPEFDIKVPSVSFRKAAFIRRVRADVEAALPWFDEFKTPEAAEANLAKYLKPESLSYKNAIQFLHSLQL